MHSKYKTSAWLALSCSVGFGGGDRRGENWSCWYFATCLQAALIQSNKHTTLMNSQNTHMGRTKPPHMPVLEHFEDFGVKMRGKRHSWIFHNVLQTGPCKSTWPVCCETGPAPVNSRMTASWSQHMLLKSSSYCILFLFFGRTLSAQLLVRCYTSPLRLLP